MTTATLSGIFATYEDHGCVYTIDTEGTLYYAPVYANGNVNMEEIAEVDFYDAIDNGVESEVTSIQDQLINMMKVAGLYFKNWF